MDRNFDTVQIIIIVMNVALRKESVDRNYYCDHDTDWIRAVALRKESVDRNFDYIIRLYRRIGRSPQGERG